MTHFFTARLYLSEASYLSSPLLSQKYMLVKKGRYQINTDVLLFPWRLTYKNPGSGLVPKGSFGKVHLAQDTATRKRMACKLVSPTGVLFQLTSRKSCPKGVKHFSCQVPFCPHSDCCCLHNKCTVDIFFYHRSERELAKVSLINARKEI